MWKATLLLLGLSACHAAMDDMNSMRGYVDDTRRETTRHLESARAAITLQDMRDEMDRHRDGMTPMMGDIDMTMDSMRSHCGGDGFGEMRTMHGELDGELTQHLSAMEATTELSAKLVEVERHAATIMTMMDGMDGAMTRMSCR